MRRALILAGLLLLPFTSHAEDQFLYVMSATAKMFAEPSFSASSVESISKGQKLNFLEKNNNWFKVEYRNKIGWISRLSVSPHPPMKRVKLVAEADDSLVNNSRLRASTVSTTAAVRGLRNDERSRASDKAFADFNALAKMEGMAASEESALEFLAGLE